MKDFLRELFRTSIYKRTQGRVIRQVTFAGLALAVAFGCWRLNQTLGMNTTIAYVIPGILAVVGFWVAYRIVNLPRFADFLIAVEAEMNKVSWPTRTELIRSSLVVLVTMFVLAGVLLVFDAFWTMIFQTLKIL
ncbi:MAG: preprotein translocase subunit SecE [Thermoguttaceae bacterium]|nr:preprotein translocase subunit SecE [Thermoguttaceae bacterium]MDW8038874.1 preprotein translocase subunit SecE [Thermoguttaceae bacterium]